MVTRDSKRIASVLACLKRCYDANNEWGIEYWTRVYNHINSAIVAKNMGGHDSD